MIHRGQEGEGGGVQERGKNDGEGGGIRKHPLVLKHLESLRPTSKLVRGK